MKRIILALLTCGLVLALAAPNAMGANAVVVESKQVAASATGVTVGVHVENDVDLSGMVVPFELREVTAGSYIATSFAFAIQGRVGSSGLMGFPTVRTGVPTWPSNACSGPVSQSFGGPFPDPPVDFVSPDCAMFAGLVTMGSNMAPGDDGLPGVGTPSFLFTFNVTGVDGFFEIDTCCVYPANHISYVDGSYSEVIPTFTKGLVTIGTPPPPNTPPVAVC
ncbi:MAG TPA: hypothetical protein VM118_00675, partial [Acidobacteriota bacterium]|nr:hypothetical protein [Acidobacteriota bacterium]